MNRTPAKHAALRRIADGGDGLGLLQAGWPDNTLDELCKAGLFTWASGECQLTEAGVETLARWGRETAEKPCAAASGAGGGRRTQAGRSAASERYRANQGASG